MSAFAVGDAVNVVSGYTGNPDKVSWSGVTGVVNEIRQLQPDVDWFNVQFDMGEEGPVFYFYTADQLAGQTA